MLNIEDHYLPRDLFYRHAPFFDSNEASQLGEERQCKNQSLGPNGDLFELQSNLFILHLLQKRLSPGVLEKSRAINKAPL